MSDTAPGQAEPGQEVASQREVLEIGASPNPAAEFGPDAQSAGSSAAAERDVNGPTYLPVRTLSKTSHQSEALEGNELK